MCSDTTETKFLAFERQKHSVACTFCLCVSSVWQSNCPLNFYEDGITGIFYKIFKTSPWVGWIGLNAVGHIIWVTILFACQLYQVLWSWWHW